jgi:hypothetical protein
LKSLEIDAAFVAEMQEFGPIDLSLESLLRLRHKE